MYIPKVIVQTWKTKDLPSEMLFYVNQIRESNPSYEHKLFDDNDCRSFLLERYGERVVEAFDKLLFGAYKADLWRYAYLYAYGGVYIDIDFEQILPLDFILTEEDKFVSVCEKMGQPGIFQAFIAIEQGRKEMKDALDLSVDNILSARRDYHHLEITGPRCLGKVLSGSSDKILSPGIHDSFRLLELKNEGVYYNETLLFNIKYTAYISQDTDRYGPSKRWHRDFKNLQTLDEKERYQEMYKHGGLYVSPRIRITKCLGDIISKNDLVFFVDSYKDGKTVISKEIFSSKPGNSIWLDIIQNDISIVLSRKDVKIIPLSQCTQYIYSPPKMTRSISSTVF